MKIECKQCNKEFSAIRPTAKFCSNSCKTKANVQRRQDEKARAEYEAQHLVEQEQLRQQTDERKIKREQRAELKKQAQAEQAELDRQAQEAKKLQDLQDEADLAELNRKMEEERMQKVKYYQLMKAQKALAVANREKRIRDRHFADLDTRFKLKVSGIAVGIALVINIFKQS